ncbi:MAG: hypothetical protein PHC59_15210 [Thomasclavelia ramosa]|nr:hypothetical protein [Thomasclavelia ramosa]
MITKDIAKIDQLRVEEILNELSECREDERSGRNQIFTILTVTATFIAAIFALLSMADNSALFNGMNFARDNIAWLANSFSTLLLASIMPWLANLGLLSTFRHFYIIKLEDELRDLLNDENRKFYHWEQVSTPFITFNLKHIPVGFSMFYTINTFITFVSLLILAVAYTIFIQTFADKFSIGNILLSVGFWMMFIIVLLTIFVASIKSKEIYDVAMEQVEERLKQKQENRNLVNWEEKKKFIKFG